QDVDWARGGRVEERRENPDVREDVHRGHAFVDRHLVSIQPEGTIEQLVALRVANRVDDSWVDRVRGPDVLVVDDVRPANLIREGTRRDEVRANEERCRPGDVDDQEAEPRLTPGEAGPEFGRHGPRYLH